MKNLNIKSNNFNIEGIKDYNDIFSIIKQIESMTLDSFNYFNVIIGRNSLCEIKLTKPSPLFTDIKSNENETKEIFKKLNRNDIDIKFSSIINALLQFNAWYISHKNNRNEACLLLELIHTRNELKVGINLKDVTIERFDFDKPFNDELFLNRTFAKFILVGWDLRKKNYKDNPFTDKDLNYVWDEVINDLHALASFFCRFQEYFINDIENVEELIKEYLTLKNENNNISISK